MTDQVSDDLRQSPVAKAARKAVAALQSEYKGVVFRSRLEARWAAIFDHFRLVWVYEPDVFETPSGGYCPDFFLPGPRAYVEVKPLPDTFDRRAVESVAKQTGCAFLILDAEMIECRAFPLFTKMDGGWFWDDMCWCMSEKYLGPRPRDGKPRFYQCAGVSHPSETASVECPSCNRTDDPDFVRIRSMRLNNGHAA